MNLKEFNEIIINENNPGYFTEHMWSEFDKIKINGEKKSISELLIITKGLEYDICSYVKNYDNKYKKYLYFKEIYPFDCTRDSKQIILRRYIAIKLRETLPELYEEDCYLTEKKCIINPNFEGKYILYRNKGQTIERVYNSFQDFLLSSDKECLFCSNAFINTKKQIIDDLKFENSDTFNTNLNGINFFNDIDNLKKIDIDDSLLNNIGIYTLYDLYRSKVYGIARNGHSYIDTLRRESYEANGQKLKVIKSKIDSYEKLSIKEKKAVQDTYSEAHVLFSHDEYLDYLNGYYKKDIYSGDGGYLILKINKELSMMLGCNDHFQTQVSNLNIFLN